LKRQDQLPPFIGYLPESVDGLLLELVNMSYQDYPPRRGRTGAQLSQERKLAIDSLRLHFKEKPHQRSVEIITDALEQQTPFCLYLRNFDLGARVYAGRDDPFGLPQNATLMPGMFDGEMQRHIQSIVSALVPALCIRNPAFDGGDVPGFIVGDDDWQALAHSLVRNAGLIVMYYLTASSGVMDELALIRSQGKQDSTLIVIEDNDPHQAMNFMEAISGVQRQAFEKQEVSLDDFPHQVRRQVGADWQAVDQKLARMAAGDLSVPVDSQMALPAEYGPPEALKEYCTEMAGQEFDAAMKLIEAQQYEEAEDVLTRSIAYAHWGRDTLGRVVTMLTLGRLNIIGFNAKGDAGAYFEMALDVCQEIRETSPMAGQLYPIIQAELARLRAEAKARDAKL